jgi:hypothetical protein
MSSALRTRRRLTCVGLLSSWIDIMTAPLCMATGRRREEQWQQQAIRCEAMGGVRDGYPCRNGAREQVQEENAFPF